ncbi:MAG TPA: antitoxin Xre/MbcA/ParS toxin-binding domain-containing protein [Anaeromyxobacteraceae bacterium]|nr:antitoxin Xre/MbcA/ParS toxin-binding domain-containing protein [Anaeromyxobacteraceae bacterium]
MDATLEAVRHEARALFRTSQATEAWLSSKNPHLGSTPSECLATGHADLVLGILGLLSQALHANPRWEPEEFERRARLLTWRMGMPAWGGRFRGRKRRLASLLFGKR